MVNASNLENSTGIILTTGSRTYTDYNTISRQLVIAIDDLMQQGYRRIRVRHGNNVYPDKPSADGLVVEFINKIKPSMSARGLDLSLDPVYADWETYGKAAGPIRNHKMVDMGLNIGLVFLNGNTPGTIDCMRYMIQKGHSPRIFKEQQ